MKIVSRWTFHFNFPLNVPLINNEHSELCQVGWSKSSSNCTWIHGDDEAAPQSRGRGRCLGTKNPKTVLDAAFDRCFPIDYFVINYLDWFFLSITSSFSSSDSNRERTLSMICSRSKRFPALLCAAEFHEDDVLYSERTSRVRWLIRWVFVWAFELKMNFACQFLKPAFTVIRDQESKCLLVFIRGTRSIKDTLIDTLCAYVSFDHNMVSGHAHRGMVVVADWISKHCIPVLLEALRQYPHFKIKVFIS